MVLISAVFLVCVSLPVCLLQRSLAWEAEAWMAGLESNLMRPQRLTNQGRLEVIKTVGRLDSLPLTLFELRQLELRGTETRQEVIDRQRTGR
jgi:hypothetical protein